MQNAVAVQVNKSADDVGGVAAHCRDGKAANLSQKGRQRTIAAAGLGEKPHSVAPLQDVCKVFDDVRVRGQCADAMQLIHIN